ncbi:MAG: LLM class F420-dependent oxidoreductase, partial [Actinobacteria bacterium]|nr:LLM class F420-dependent oxidoreductase [Actinomycetota bacterium]
KRTLRLVAQYGDACNLFGDPDTVRHKLEVLERHCADVGRDPSEITKTVLQTVRDPAAAAEQLKAFTAVGVEGVVVNIPDVSDLGAVAQAGETLRSTLVS